MLCNFALGLPFRWCLVCAWSVSCADWPMSVLIVDVSCLLCSLAVPAVYNEHNPVTASPSTRTTGKTNTSWMQQTQARCYEQHKLDATGTTCKINTTWLQLPDIMGKREPLLKQHHSMPSSLASHHAWWMQMRTPQALLAATNELRGTPLPGPAITWTGHHLEWVDRAAVTGGL